MNGFERRKQQKKAIILQTALKLFMEKGPQKVAVTDIAKQAGVSQVTIYNYFGSKDDLIDAALILYTDQIWEEFNSFLDSDKTFPEKVSRIIFDKKTAAAHVHLDFFDALMNEYTNEKSYIDTLYTEKALPRLMELFNEGKEQGYVDPGLSNDVLILNIQLFKEGLKNKQITEIALPLTEELTTIFFYGVAGKQGKTD